MGSSKGLLMPTPSLGPRRGWRLLISVPNTLLVRRLVAIGQAEKGCMCVCVCVCVCVLNRFSPDFF